MADLLQQLCESDDELLKAQAEDASKWQNLKHNKVDLETLLQFSIVRITFKTKEGKKSEGTFTSSTPFIKALQAKKLEEKKKAAELKSDGIHTKDPFSVDSWCIEERKLKTISLKSWQILGILNITPSRILLIDKCLKKVLK